MLLDNLFISWSDLFYPLIVCAKSYLQIRPSSSFLYLLTVGVEGVHFHLITPRHTTVSRNPLDEGSARHRDLYLTTLSQETNLHASGRIRTHDPSKRSAADLRLRPRGHWDRHLQIRVYKIIVSYDQFFHINVK
jgi:hypothetical protein